MAKGKEYEETKQDLDMFVGGCEIDLDKDLDGEPLRNKLSAEIGTILDEALRNQEPLLKKLRKWEKMYKGIRPPKNFPYTGAANTAIPLTRWLTETVLVRIIDTLFSQKKVWIARARKKGYEDLAIQIEDGLDWWQRWIVKFRKSIFSPLLQAIKMGTGVIYMPYVREKRTMYRYPTKEEVKDSKIKKYVAKNGEKVVKIPETVYDGPKIYPISREDFVISSDATCIKDAFLVGYRTYISKSKFKARVASGYYDIDESTVESIIKGDELDETKRERIADAFKEVDPGNRDRVAIWELWFSFDVDGDDEADDIVMSYHVNTKTPLRARYNEYFYGFRPFKEFVFNPVEYMFDGDGMCTMLEQLQEEMDTVHNQRLDRMNQINAPVYLRRSGSGIGDQKIHPGAILDVDDIETAYKEFVHHDVYPSTERTESLIVQYAMNVAGVSPNQMGQSTSERPVARETLALIQELNKKYKFFIDNLREDVAEIAMMAIEEFTQFQPTYTYRKKTGEVLVEDNIVFPVGELLRDAVDIEVMASSEVLNTEVRREINLTLYQLLTDYSTKLAGMVQALESPMTPPGLRDLIIQVGEISAKLLERIIDDFGITDSESLVPKISEKSVKMSGMMPYMPQGMPPQGGQGAPPMAQPRF